VTTCLPTQLQMKKLAYLIKTSCFFAFNGKNHTSISEDWRTTVQLSQDIQIIRRINVVSIFSVICHCKCANEAQRVEKIYCCAIRVLKSGQLTVHPGYRGANETSIRKTFSNRYFGAIKYQARKLWSREKTENWNQLCQWIWCDAFHGTNIRPSTV
jgi:hypothetical protein